MADLTIKTADGREDEVTRLRGIIAAIRKLAEAHRFVDTTGTGESSDMNRIRQVLEQA